MLQLLIKCPTNESMRRTRDEFSAALSKTPTFGSEIAICECDATSFSLLIGSNDDVVVNKIIKNINILPFKEE